MENDNLSQPKRRGRPPKAVADSPAEAGLGALVSARVTVETRKAIEEKSRKTGYSISQVMERWLSQAAELDGMLSGLHVEEAVHAMIRVAHAIEVGVAGERAVGNPQEDSYAREALLAGWNAIIQGAFPFTPPSQAESAKSQARETLHGLLQEIQDVVLARTCSEALTFAVFAERPQAALGYATNVLAQTTSAAPQRSLIYLIGDALRRDSFGAYGLEHPVLRGQLAEALRFVISQVPDESVRIDDILTALKNFEAAWNHDLNERAAAYRRGRDLATALASRRATAHLVAARAREMTQAEATDKS